MDIAHIRDYTHRHCRFRLKSGKEVFGVIWEVDPGDKSRLYFASVQEYERLRHDPGQRIDPIPMRPDEIIHVQDLAS